MKITEITWENGKRYEDNYSRIWEVIDFNALILKNNTSGKKYIKEVYTIKSISQLNFTEVIDWSKVEVDTKIWVRDEDTQDWKPRHFAKYEGGWVYAWNNGKTSHTTQDSKIWNYASTTKPE